MLNRRSLIGGLLFAPAVIASNKLMKPSFIKPQTYPWWTPAGLIDTTKPFELTWTQTHTEEEWKLIQYWLDLIRQPKIAWTREQHRKGLTHYDQPVFT